MNATIKPGTDHPDDLASRLRRLTPAQVLRVDELLVHVGEYGEVHLIVERGQLRYLNTVESHKAWDDGAPPKK